MKFQDKGTDKLLFGTPCFCAGAALLVICFLAFASPALAGSIFDDNGPPPPAKSTTQPAAEPKETPAAPSPVKIPAVPQPSPSEPPIIPASPPTGARTPTISPRPVPPAAALANSRKLLKEVYASDMADHASAARRSLAAKLLTEAQRSIDVSSDYYVLLMGARQSAVEGGDLSIAFKACDTLGDAFNLDALRMKLDATKKINAVDMPPSDERKNTQLLLALCDDLMNFDDYNDPADLIRLMFANSSGDPALRAKVTLKVVRINALRAAWERVAGDVNVLATAPNDPRANYAIGSFYCFVKGNWPHGLPMLAKGSDAAIRDIAKLDLAASAIPANQDGAAMAAVADGWWTLAEKQQEEQIKTRMQSRAAYWYQEALPQLSGLEQQLAQRRLAQQPPIEGDEAHLPGGGGLESGLVAELYSDPDFSRLVKKRIDRQVYFEWGDQGPDPAIHGDRFAIRWTGVLNVTRAATYAWQASADDRLHLWIDDKPVLASENPTRDTHATVDLQAGRHSVKIEYVNTGGEGRCELRWAAQGGFDLQPLPRDAFWHNPADARGADPASSEWCSGLICSRVSVPAIRESAPAGAALVGFELTQENDHGHVHLRSLRAIYRGPSGESLGRQFGKPEKFVYRLEARAGYAISRIRGTSDHYINSITVTFMHVRGDGLDPSDSYDGPVYGPNTGDKTDIGDGHPIVGIYGSAHDNIGALGLMTAE